MASTGLLQVSLLNANKVAPIEGAKVKITKVGEGGAQTQSAEYTTGISGETINIELPTPDIENSMRPSEKLPYSLYDVDIENEGYVPLKIKGVQVMPEELAIQMGRVEPEQRGCRRQAEQVIVVDPNTLVGNYPPKIPENPEKPLPPPPSGFVVLPEPVIPELVVVHQGGPEDASAPNYTVRFKDYIKNVASCEIFATWPESTIRANVYCILSFTINRIYTEWYRGKGKDFDITNSTAYDHAFSYGRTIYESISNVVDDIFTNYVKRFGQKQPLLTQYCDGVKVQCPGWMTQWGSKYLGDEGKSPYEILTNFYGRDLEIVEAKRVAGIPMSYPGYTLGIGSSGEPVRTVQRFLNRIGDNFPAIPKVRVDGIYGENTANAVREFQKIFHLPISGTVNYPTWYAISDIYVGVSKIAELRSDYTRSDYRGEKKIFIPHRPHKNVYDVPTTEYYDDIF
ncbi:Putative peptidoglycan-binding domain-containing protein [Hathewaya proteolytica DSM 3090]|uniref:Putative peptidoglycan-binding domain-containing protein n=1 Tax=Hathewaya proteolytica DSM 3090 TaxID=1121331 RepID=A0A1M6MEY2_9CLOT|nr:peptidoglycan-binding domain-containing protein [Hathewaya proteolytica]SHJ82024.1 Putative peptidoglycan-binding domain-containing protein [Hathewaya proteolytica DSM 3090]